MKNNKPIPPEEVRLGMRVKVPFPGYYFGNFRKKLLWFKGTVVYIYKKREEIKGVKVSYRAGNGQRDMGRWLLVGENLNIIRKTL